MSCFGRTSGSWSAQEAYQPTIKSFVRDIDKSRCEDCNPASKRTIPAGSDFHIAESQLAIEPGSDEFPFFKASYGFASSIAEATCNDADSPLKFTIALKLPFKYGISRFSPKRIFRDTGQRFLGVFSLSAQFPGSFAHRSSLNAPYAAVSLGDAARGFIRWADSKYKTSNLLAWRTILFSE